MPAGDDAAAAGMDTVNPAADFVKDGAEEINRTRDYVAQRTNAIEPITGGGTGADNAADARVNLGVQPTVDAVANAADGSTPNALAKYGPDGRLNHLDPTAPSHVASKNYVDAAAGQAEADAIGWAADRLNGGASPIYNNHGRANPIGGAWVAAAFGNDGRIAIQPSARKFKQNIRPRIYTVEQAAEIGALVVEYRLKAAVKRDGQSTPYEVGVIADDLLTLGYPEFVVLDAEGEPLSIHYEQMVVVALSAFVEVAQRLAALEATSPSSASRPETTTEGGE